MPDIVQRPPERESVWKRLTRLFRSGPVVRHKVAAGEQLREPKGTARAYKKELSSLYVHSLASYGQYERLSRYSDFCLTGDTRVSVPYVEGTLTMREIVERYSRGEKTLVYSYDIERASLVISTVSNAFSTGVREVWKITLDDGTVVRCTDNHPFMLRDGSYLRADNLCSGTSLMPFRRWTYNGYRFVANTDGVRSEHQLVCESVHSVPRDVFQGMHVHHRNFVRTDNSPDNLVLMTEEEHLSFHARINNRRFEDPGQREAMSHVMSARWSAGGDLREKYEAGLLYSDERREADRERRVKFNKEFRPGRMNRGRQDQKGLDNANADRSFTFQHVCDAYTPGMRLSDLCRALGQTPFKVKKRVQLGGFSDFDDFSRNYTNHKVVSVEKTGEFEEVFDITVDKYHNFAIENSILVHNCEMEFTPEIASALDIYADEATAYDENNAIIDIVSRNQEVKDVLETLFFDILNIEFNIWSWVRNLCKYGDFVLFVDASDENGILNLLPIPINEIEREEGYDPRDPFAVRFRWLTQGNTILENWQVIHFRLLGNDTFLPYGASIIEPARRIWRQLILIEDAMLVYRIVRSPERRVFKIDVGNIPPDQVDQFMEQIKTRLRRNQIVDPTTGRVDLRYNPLSVDEDYFLPVRGDRSSDISTLAGGQFTGDIDDVQYIQNKLFAALKVPKAYLGYEGELGSKATLSQQDVRFARTIERIQKIVIAELSKIAIIHLFLLGYEGEDLVDFKIEMASSSTIAEQQKLELWRMRFEIAGTAQEGMLDRETIYKKIFNMTDEDIERVREGKRVDKMEDLTLEAMQAPEQAAAGQDVAAARGAPGGEAVPGEAELPQTLGGEPGGEGQEDQGAAAGGQPQVAPEGTTHDGAVLEKRNPGSEGDDATVAVDKGKDMFATGEDQFTAVFGTEKQTASDPGDLRALRRLVTRPFSEETDLIETRMREGALGTEDVDRGLTQILRGVASMSVVRSSRGRTRRSPS